MKPAATLVLTRDTRAIAPPLSANRVLRNTYWLLSLTLLFSAGAAALTAALKLSHPGIVITLIGYFGLLFITVKLRLDLQPFHQLAALAGLRQQQRLS